MGKQVLSGVILVLAVAALANAAHIPGVAARASSEHWAMLRGPGLVVDDSGMDEETLMHDNNWAHMWLSGPMSASFDNPHGGAVAGSHWIEFDLQQAYELASMAIWNRSEENWPWFGMKDVTIQYSVVGGTNPADWSTIFVGTIPLSNGAWTPAALTVPFDGAEAQYVVITAAWGEDVFPGSGDRNWFYDRSPYYDEVGLSEVRFYEVPEPATMILLGLGGLALLRRRL